MNPIRDTKLMHDINVNGTKNVFEAVRAIRPQRFLMASSATAYGAWPGNPVPIPEDWPIRACAEFQYSANKAALEAEIKTLHDELPDVAVAWTRARGPFNVGPPDCLPLTKLAKLTNRRAISLPYWSMKMATTIWWGLRLPIFDVPPSLHHFSRYPWVVSPARLQNDFGFQFRYSCEETLLEMWAEHRRKKWKMRNGECRHFAIFILHFSFSILLSKRLPHQVSHVRVRGFQVDVQPGFSQGFGTGRADRSDAAALSRRQE